MMFCDLARAIGFSDTDLKASVATRILTSSPLREASASLTQDYLVVEVFGGEDSSIQGLHYRAFVENSEGKAVVKEYFFKEESKEVGLREDGFSQASVENIIAIATMLSAAGASGLYKTIRW